MSRNSKKKSGWHKIPDSRIRHRWDLNCRCEQEKVVYVAADFYKDGFTPICNTCGTSRKYISTEIRIAASKPSKPITITMEGGVIQAIDDIPKSIQVKVLDFDTDGVPDTDLTKLNNGQKCVVAEWGKK